MRSRVVALLLALAAASRAGAAQGATDPAGVVIVHAAPATFQVVSVDIPAGGPGDSTIAWRASATGRVQLLGAAAGRVARARRTLLLTLAVPAGQPPGRVRALEIEFALAAGGQLRRAVDVDVAAVSQIDVSATSSTIGARVGELAATRFRLWNRGNALDTVSVRALVPAGWRVQRTPPPVVLPPDGRAEVVVQTRVAADAGAGTFRLRLEARASGGGIASTEAAVRVIGLEPRGRDAERPTLTLGAAAGRGPGRETGTGLMARLHGRVAGDVAVDAEAPLSSGQPRASRALSNVGFWQAPARVTFSAESWRASVGPSYSRFSEIAGADLLGRGIALDVLDSNWDVRTFTARPYSSRGGEGTLGAAAVARSVGALRLGVEGAHLDETGALHRQLDAAGATLALRLAPTNVIAADVVERRWDGGRGLGGRVSYAWRQRESSFNAYAFHAPGGTNAFARAATEYAAAGFRPITSRLLVGGSALVTRDSTTSWHSIESRSIAIAPSYRLTRDVSLLLEGSTFRYAAAGDAGATENRDDRVLAGVSVQRGFAYATLTGAERAIERTTTSDSVRRHGPAPRQDYRGTLGARGPLGDAQLFATLERGRPLSGFAGQYSVYGMRLDRVALIPGRGLLLGNGYFALAQVANHPAIATLRLGVRTAVTRATRLVAAAERDPYANEGRSRSWIFAIALQHDVGLPRLASGPGGTIFHDTNNNGRMDRGEAGVPGVILRNLDMTTVTDEHGHYRFDRRTSGRLRLDPASIPGDLVPPPALRSDSLRRTIGLIRVTAVHVDLVVEGEVASRVDSLDLAAVVVTARDSAGRPWVGRTAAPGRVELDALPPGRYRLEVDASRSTEPLTVPDTLPSFVIAEGAPVPRVRVVLRTRGVRIRNFGSPVAPAAP